jgi:Protein of unknown function (DUF2637)
VHRGRASRPADRLILIEGNPKGCEVARLVLAPQRADKWISRAATVTVAGLAGIASAISYSHMRQLAAAHGDTGWHTHAFPPLGGRRGDRRVPGPARRPDLAHDLGLKPGATP